MDNNRRDEYKQKLYDLTPVDGKAISNPSLREALKAAITTDGITQDDYWDLRNSLISDGKLQLGRGQGGSVRRVLLPVAVAVPVVGPVAPEVAVEPNAREADLYKPFQTVIETGYVQDNDIRPWICEITAAQGRRSTGGLWTRPDVTLVAIQTFAYLPNKQFDVITFEIKPSIDTAMEGVYEAAAHSAFAHRSYLAFPDGDYENSPVFDRIVDECERFGLGLIVFEDVKNWDTYTFEVRAQRKTPDLESVNEFIKIQINEKNREEIQRWFR